MGNFFVLVKLIEENNRETSGLVRMVRCIAGREMFLQFLTYRNRIYGYHGFTAR